MDVDAEKNDIIVITPTVRFILKGRCQTKIMKTNIYNNSIKLNS